MKERFPTVGIIGAGQLTRMAVAPAQALGINLLLFAESPENSAAQISPYVVGDFRSLEALKEFAKRCDVITFEHDLVSLAVIKGLEATSVKVFPTADSIQYSQDKSLMRKKLSDYPINEELVGFDFEISVLVARSPHRQVVTWAPTQIVRIEQFCASTITPAPSLSPDLAEKAQLLALSIANELSVIGVMAIEIFVKGSDIFIKDIFMHPHYSGYWTLDGANTSIFEQHLRAILDLPLGDPKMTAPFAVTGNVLGGEKTDMYRPYLHLMARNPNLKFHQYRKKVLKGRAIGHVTVVGENLLELTEIIDHARDYMSGEIDE